MLEASISRAPRAEAVVPLGPNGDDDVAVRILPSVLLRNASIRNILGHIEHRARVMSEVRTRRKKQEPHREKANAKWFASSSSILESLILTGACWRTSLPPKHAPPKLQLAQFCNFSTIWREEDAM